MSVALVVLDTLRKDHFDQHFDWLPGRRHEQLWSNSHWTVPAHAALFTGERPSEVGIHAKNFYYDDDVRTIADHFESSIAYTANPNISPHFGATKDFSDVVGDVRIDALREDIFNWNRFIQQHLDAGPMRYYKAIKECITSDVNTLESLKYGLIIKLQDLGVAPDSHNHSAQKFLSEIRGRPLSEDFLFMNLMEAHAPYDPPAEYGAPDCQMEGLRYTFADAPNPDAVREAYDASVRYLSDMYADIFEELQASFDTVVTIADHGELLGEHGGWEHLYGIYPELVHVPCVVSGDPIGLPTRPIDLRDIYDAITGTTTERDVLPVEYHGLNEQNRIGAQNKGIDIPAYMDEPRIGAVTSAGYRYEDVQGRRCGSDAISDTVLRDLEFEVLEGDTSVSDEVQQQLENLGYA